VLLLLTLLGKRSVVRIASTLSYCIVKSCKILWVIMLPKVLSDHLLVGVIQKCKSHMLIPGDIGENNTMRLLTTINDYIVLTCVTE